MKNVYKAYDVVRSLVRDGKFVVHCFCPACSVWFLWRLNNDRCLQCQRISEESVEISKTVRLAGAEDMVPDIASGERHGAEVAVTRQNETASCAWSDNQLP